MITINPSRWARILGVLSASLIVFLFVNEAGAVTAKRPLKPRQVSSLQQLRQLLANKTLHGNYFLAASSARLADSPSALGAMAETSGGVEHSDTNVQVQGVDEGDTVKTDGQYIYSIQAGQVRIVRAYPADGMAAVASLPADAAFTPIELYVQDELLVVIGSGWQAQEGNAAAASASKANAKTAIWLPLGESRTIARVYDVSEPSNPVLQREIAFTGDYLSSRKIGSSVYLLGRNYPRYFFNYFAGQASKAKSLAKAAPRNLLPHVRDSAANNGKERLLPPDDIYYFPGFVEPDYVIVAGFKLDAPDDKADIKAFLGSGDTSYASSQNLYLSAADYNFDDNGQMEAPITHLYKFALNNGQADFLAMGEVPGVVLNSFSLDEYNDYLRIATTVDLWTQTGDSGALQTWSNLYTLDKDMNIAGRLEHLAEGERIYAARFIGERGYLVTFQQTDPLSVLDLSVPEAPKVLGELVIPGFSNYLHPYDENHLLGFGQETETTADGVVTKGMKIALFDVTDVGKPSQLHSLTIGAQGTYSPLLYDHKALLFDKKRGLLGFPISETAQKPGADWPEEVFQGAYLYKVSLSDGFQKQAAISHQETGQNYDWNHYVQHLLTIGEQLYTLSETRVQANSLSDFALTGEVDFPVADTPTCFVPLAEAKAAADTVVDCPILVDPPLAAAGKVSFAEGRMAAKY